MPQHKKELERLIKLTEYDLDYSDLSKYMDDLTRLAAKIAGTEVSLINLIDNFTQWSVSDYGIDVDQMPREDSVCQYTIMEAESFEVNNLIEDDRFKDKSYVKGDPALRYYYGVPLKTENGLPIGALCVLDKSSKDLDPEKKELLNMVAKEVVQRLDSMKAMKELKEEVHNLKQDKKKLSHDIRGPISGIIGVAEIIQAQGDTNKMDDILELISLVKKGGESVLELAEEIMNNNSDEPKEPGSEEFNCKTFAEKLRKLYKPQAISKEVEFSVETKNNTEAVIFPKAKLLQIAGNLISNSIKFTPQNGKVNVILDVLQSDEDSRELKIIVKDTGVGIEEDKIKEILSGGTDTTSGTGGEKGYGFGLSLVNHLVESSNGTINIQSETGKGTEFIIRIPF